MDCIWKVNELRWVVGISPTDYTRVLVLWGECVPWGVFQRDPSPYLREFHRKPRKTPHGYNDTRDQELNPAPPVYQF